MPWSDLLQVAEACVEDRLAAIVEGDTDDDTVGLPHVDFGYGSRTIVRRVDAVSRPEGVRILLALNLLDRWLMEDHRVFSNWLPAVAWLVGVAARIR